MEVAKVEERERERVSLAGVCVRTCAGWLALQVACLRTQASERARACV